MTKSKRRARPQKQKANVQRVQELRQGSTTTPHRSDKDYRRKPKHGSWDE